MLRRYSDFLWLYETLSANNPGVIVPPVPEKSPFGRFDETFVQQRRLALEKCIQKIVNHPVLAKDPDLKLFLESDTFSLDVRYTVLLLKFPWLERYTDQTQESRAFARKGRTHGIYRPNLDGSAVS